MTLHEPQHAVFSISVAAELVGSTVPNLRAYERRGLVSPTRTAGGTRRYSALEVRRLRRVVDLLEAGLNLVGIAMVLDLEERVQHLERRLDEASAG